MRFIRFLLLLVSCASTVTVAQTTQPARQADLLAMGDWGSGDANQRAVAKTLADYAFKQNPPILAMLLAGDNFYNNLSGVDDPEWQRRFEQMYDPQKMNFPFFAALGNHDYEKDKWKIELAYAKKNPNSRFKMPSQWYRVDLPAENPIVTVLVLDSDRSILGETKWSEELAWMREQLSAPRKTRWTIAVAHHPLFSNGAHGDNGVLQKEWGSIFREFGLDLYLCGHDHDLQHLEIENFPVSLVLCGGGGANVRAMAVDRRGPFSKTAFGFAHLTVTDDLLRVRLVDKEGKPLHEFTRDHSGKVEIVFTTPSDAAIPRTPKSISRDDDSDRKSATQPAGK